MVELHRPQPRGDRRLPRAVGARDETPGTVRFPPVVTRDERVMEAPPMPTVALKPRPAPTRAAAPGGEGAVNPVDALREIGFCWNAHARTPIGSRRTDGPPTSSPVALADDRARTGPRQLARDRRHRTQDRAVIEQVHSGRVPAYLPQLRDAQGPPSVSGQTGCAPRSRGDLHTHSTWSDGGSRSRR